MINFVNFLLRKVYSSIEIDKEIVYIAFEKTVIDVKYHYPDLDEDIIKNRIETNNNELAIYLFRLGQIIHEMNLDKLKQQIHWLLKQCCSCEIYFNNQFEEGFYVVHGQGTVIGSRNKIGKGFVVHQGCTIGHKRNGSGTGNKIGDNVTLCAKSSIIWELNIGNNVVIGAHVLITKDILDNTVITITNNIN